jgi:uncharacterized protein (DUF362 family)
MSAKSPPFIAELDEAAVASIAVLPLYPTQAPFHPSAPYPELRQLYAATIPTAAAPNPAYAALRELFRALAMDGAALDQPCWNPLGDVVRPGDLVVVKPNWVKESHLLKPEAWEEVITHPALIRAVVDYVLIALRGEGRVVIADGPQTDSSFAAIARISALDALQSHYHALGAAAARVEILDLRQEEHITRDGVIVSRSRLPGDPAGYVDFDLGAGSEFVGHQGRYFGACFDLDETNRAHSGGHHHYRISGTVARADVVLNLPKLKTHKKCGITASLKNMVGINGWKNFLPHHSEGTPRMGGDQFPSDSWRGVLEYHLMGRFKALLVRSPDWIGNLLRHLKKPGRVAFGDTEEVVRSGNWYGNDTIWRTVLDLNKILLYGRADGSLAELPVRRYFSIVDGIVGGEGNGPMCPDRVDSGLLIGGRSPVAVDLACAVEMGLDPRRIPSIYQAMACRRWPLARFTGAAVRLFRLEGEVEPAWAVDPTSKHRFRPHFGWAGQIELEAPIGPKGFRPASLGSAANRSSSSQSVLVGTGGPV